MGIETMYSVNVSQVATVSFEGVISDIGSKDPLSFATVQLLHGDEVHSVLSKDNGVFSFPSVHPGDYILRITYVGYDRYEKRVTLKRDTKLTVKMAPPGNSLNEIVVTARESQGLVSSSKINREMMTHLQPTSFSDLLELLPGNISKTPSMGQVNSIQLRETGTLNSSGEQYSNPDYAITSLGTLFLVDGAPLNGDANLQYIPGGTSSDGTSPESLRNMTNKGVDMRTLTTDDIESVEIVRGIPSAEYGNLTSGMVNIKRVRKATPLTARFKADEYSKLFSVGKGFTVPNHDFTLNVDGGFLDSKVDPRNNLENYKRVNFSVRISKLWKRDKWEMTWTPSADYTGSFDNVKTDPDLSYQKIDKYKSSYNRASLTNNFKWTFPRLKWIKTVNLDASVSAQSDQLKRTKLISPQRATVAPTGKEPGVHDGTYLFSEYVADYLCDGKPVNAFLKAKGEFGWEGAKYRLNAKAGGEWNYSKNFGKGQVYDLSHPISTSWGARPRAYSDIPALQNLSFFLEGNTLFLLGKNKLELQVGARSVTQIGMSERYLLQGKPYIDPRANAQWSFPAIPVAGRDLHISISGGYGVTTKMPTLDYLYPDLWYNDIVQLNYYDVNKPLEYSRVNIITYIEDITNYDLKPARNHKWEVRGDISFEGNRLSVTYFHENLTSGFRTSSFYAPFSYRKYDHSAVDASGLQGPPALEDIPYTDMKALNGYRQSANGSRIDKQGIEFQFTSQRISALRTAVVINGAWFRSVYTNSRPMFETVADVVDNRPVSEEYVGLYDWNDGRVNEQFNTNFQLDTQIPEWGLIFSTSVQCMWFVSTRVMWKNGIPVSYMAASDGKLYPYTEESAADPKLQFLIKTYNGDLYKKQTIPTAVYVNLKATKTIGKWLRLSLFANRILDYLPSYKMNGLLIRRNVDPYFGMELNFTL